MTMTLDALRNKDLLRILLFVGSVPDLLSCEKTCRKLRNVVQSDQAWSTCDGEWHDDRIETNRQRAERKYRKHGYKEEAIQSIHEHQRSKLFNNLKDEIHREKNYILLTYGVDGWREFCSKCISKSIGSRGGTLADAYRWDACTIVDAYRWDALLCCAHILETNLLEFLDVSIRLSIHRTREQENVYPVLKDVDLTLAAHTTYPILQRLRAVEKNIEMDDQARILVTHMLRTAGIPSSEASARQLFWECFMELTIELLRLAYLWGNSDVTAKDINTISMEHVEWAAEHLKLLFYKAYGINETAVETGDDESEAVDLVDENGFIEIASSSSAADDGGSNDSMSLTDEETVDFSIYSDTECRDSML